MEIIIEGNFIKTSDFLGRKYKESITTKYYINTEIYTGQVINDFLSMSVFNLIYMYNLIFNEKIKYIEDLHVKKLKKYFKFPRTVSNLDPKDFELFLNELIKKKEIKIKYFLYLLKFKNLNKDVLTHLNLFFEISTVKKKSKTSCALRK